MSKRNKIEEKQSRRNIRGFLKSPRGTTQIGRVPQEISANILSNPKQMKLSGRSRRRLQRNRGLVVLSENEPPKNFAVKVAVKLTRLTLAQLFRRQAQTARRAATVRYIIASLSEGSMFSAKLKQHQTYHLSLLRQIRAEILSRQKS